MLRESREISDKQEKLNNERKILRFLEEKEIDSVPESILFDEHRGFHIISHVGREKVEVKNLEGRLLEKWVEKLVEIHGLTFENYVSFCKSNNFSFEQPEKAGESIEGLEKDAERLSWSEADVKKLVERELEKLRDFLPDLPDQEFRFTHSDIANSTRKTCEDFYFIDWEFARFSPYPIIDLSILFTNSKISSQKIDEILDLYADKQDLPENYRKIFRYGKEFRTVFNLIWLQKRLNRTDSREEKERYRRFMESQQRNLES